MKSIDWIKKTTVTILCGAMLMGISCTAWARDDDRFMRRHNRIKT